MSRSIAVAVAGVSVVLLIAIVVAADRDMLPAWMLGFYSRPGGDKLGHFVLMGWLAFVVQLAVAAVRRESAPSGARALVARSTLVVAAVVALEELSQLAFLVRTPSLLDLAASLAGIACGAWLAGRVTRRPPAPADR